MQKPGCQKARRELHNSAAAKTANRKANGAPPAQQRHYACLEVCVDSDWAVQNVVVPSRYLSDALQLVDLKYGRCSHFVQPKPVLITVDGALAGC